MKRHSLLKDKKKANTNERITFKVDVDALEDASRTIATILAHIGMM